MVLYSYMKKVSIIVTTTLCCSICFCRLAVSLLVVVVVVVLIFTQIGNEMIGVLMVAHGGKCFVVRGSSVLVAALVCVRAFFRFFLFLIAAPVRV